MSSLENLPYAGKIVYYSGTIKGAPELDPELPWQIVRFMAKGGAYVNSEHVAARSKAEMDEIRARNVGTTVEKLLAEANPWFGIRKQDIAWVDESSHIVSLVNAASTGVGTEIQRALDWWYFRRQVKPILSLIHQDRLDSLSYMIRGINRVEHPAFNLKAYQDNDQALYHVDQFLRKY